MALGWAGVKPLLTRLTPRAIPGPAQLPGVAVWFLVAAAFADPPGYSAAMAALRATPAPLWAAVLVTIAAQTLGAMRRKRR